MAKHFIKKCKNCKCVIMQCRCPAPEGEEKKVEWGICSSCGNKLPLHRRAALKLMSMKIGKGSAGMAEHYHMQGRTIYRNDPKDRMSKKERIRRRWAGRDRFGDQTRT